MTLTRFGLSGLDTRYLAEQDPRCQACRNTGNDYYIPSMHSWSITLGPLLFNRTLVSRFELHTRNIDSQRWHCKPPLLRERRQIAGPVRRVSRFLKSKPTKPKFPTLPILKPQNPQFKGRQRKSFMQNRSVRSQLKAQGQGERR